MATVLMFLQLFLLVVSPILAEELDFNFDKIETVPITNKVGNVEIKVEKTGSNQFLISGSFNQLIPLDDNWQVEASMDVSPSADGEYTNLVTLPKMGVCEMMQTLYKDNIYEKLKKVYSLAPPPDTCPVPVHNYSVTKYPLDLKKYEQFFFQGYFKVILKLFNGDTQEAVITAFAHVN